MYVSVRIIKLAGLSHHVKNKWKSNPWICLLCLDLLQNAMGSSLGHFSPLHGNWFSRFCIILQTNRPTNKQQWKHHRLRGDSSIILTLWYHKYYNFKHLFPLAVLSCSLKLNYKCLMMFNEGNYLHVKVKYLPLELEAVCLGLDIHPSSILVIR